MASMEMRFVGISHEVSYNFISFRLARGLPNCLLPTASRVEQHGLVSYAPLTKFAVEYARLQKVNTTKEENHRSGEE
jgi:hypothetical protein